MRGTRSGVWCFNLINKCTVVRFFHFLATVCENTLLDYKKRLLCSTEMYETGLQAYENTNKTSRLTKCVNVTCVDIYLYTVLFFAIERARIRGIKESL